MTSGKGKNSKKHITSILHITPGESLGVEDFVLVQPTEEDREFFRRLVDGSERIGDNPGDEGSL